MSLDLALLGALAEADRHGYEIRKRLAQLPGLPAPISFGSLYPALARLERHGLVRVAGELAPSSVPMTGSLGGERLAFLARLNGAAKGKGQRVFTITDAGRERFARLVRGEGWSPDDEAGFLLRLSFAPALPEPDATALLERRAAYLRAELEEVGAATVRTGSEQLDAGETDPLRWRPAIDRRQRLLVEAELGWIEELLVHARAPAGPLRRS
jgi:DNA-binding PadR family transcriptional regulator